MTGAANRRRGHSTELAVVAWLRAHGHPDAATTRSRLGHDGFHAPGDIIGVPGLVIEAKDVKSSAWPTWCRQAQQEAAGTPWVVVRRLRGVRDVGLWPCVASLTATGSPPYDPIFGPGAAIRHAAKLDRWVQCHGLVEQAAGRFAWLFDYMETTR